MARIPNNELDRLKREVALVRLVESSGIELKKHGKDYLGLCPFHDDKEPSLVISPDKNLWHCLGACAEGGDVIQWVIKRQGVSFRHAVELLKDGDAALSVPASPVKRNTTAKHSASLAANPDDQKQPDRINGVRSCVLLAAFPIKLIVQSKRQDLTLFTISPGSFQAKTLAHVD